MNSRILIAIIVHACVLQAPWMHAQSQSPDNFIPTQPVASGDDAKSSESKEFKYILLLPGEKSSEAVKEAERNPFGKSDDEMQEPDGKSSNEETQIQEQLSLLRATGFSPGPDGLRVLFGDMWLSKNDIMPPVIKDQTLALRVNEITRDAIRVSWIEKKSTGLPPRVLVIPVDLRATVRRVPFGQVPEKDETKHESVASKRATAVEMPVVVLGHANPTEARKAAQLAMAQMKPAVTKISEAKDTASAQEAPAPVSYAETQDSSVQAILEPEIAGPPAPPSADKAPLMAAQPDESAGKKPAAQVVDDPPAWKRAMGLMENLVKLSEANK